MERKGLCLGRGGCVCYSDVGGSCQRAGTTSRECSGEFRIPPRETTIQGGRTPYIDRRIDNKNLLSLANSESCRISAFVCHIPSFLVFSLSVAYLAAFFLNFEYYAYMVLALAFYLFVWGAHLAVLSCIGVYKMRAAVSTDWDKEWEYFKKKNPGCEQGMLHFVVLPNYAEDEEMLAQTICNISFNTLAKEHMVCVLAMEQREGDSARKKANRLIEKHQHLFLGMFATFHPENLSNELKGKSSNTQWAFRVVQKWYKENIVEQNAQHDTSKVFLTVADADSIHHRGYFTAVTIKGLGVEAKNRSWTVWQPPILNVRNVESVPALIRTSSYGSTLFEIAGLVSAHHLHHFCFSAYNMMGTRADKENFPGINSKVKNNPIQTFQSNDMLFIPSTQLFHTHTTVYE